MKSNTKTQLRTIFYYQGKVGGLLAAIAREMQREKVVSLDEYRARPRRSGELR